MTKPRRFYTQATDSVTRKQFDRQVDRLERLYQCEKAARKALQDRVHILEERLSFTVPEYREKE